MKKSFRPTKAASKRRRDLLNTEISHIRGLLPFVEMQRKRLSQIQVMSMCNAYITLNGFMADFCLKDDNFEPTLNDIDMDQILPGFLLILSRSGQVLYVSDGVIDYLGYSSMELLTQGDSVYDFVEAEDHSDLKLFLESMCMPDEFSSCALRSLSCRMILAQNFRNLYGYQHYRMMNVKGRVVRRPTKGSLCRTVPEAIFVALVTPHSKPFLDSFDFPSFQSVHGLDMKFIEIEHNGLIWLGYNVDEIKSKSWYELLHPNDLSGTKEIHLNLLQCRRRDNRSSLCIRIQTRYGHFVWLRVTMQVRRSQDKLEIVCSNYVVTDENVQELVRDYEPDWPDVLCAGPNRGEPPAFCGANSSNVGFGFNDKRLSRSSAQGSVMSESNSEGFSRARRRTATESTLRSPYPLLKGILNRPTIRDLHLPATLKQSSSASLPVPHAGISTVDSLLTPQNSPPEGVVLQEFPHEDDLSQTRVYAPEGLPTDWGMKPVGFSGWEQGNVPYGCCETPPMDHADCMAEFDSGLTETPLSGFERDVETLPLDMIVDALKAIQSDPEFSKEVESLDLGVFSKSFPDLEKKNVFASKLPLGLRTNRLVNALLPCLNSTTTKLSSDQVENLNQRLSELKKIHEALVCEAIVETLHFGNAKSSSSWNRLQDFGMWGEATNL